jgi:hypothetical protein
MNIFALGGCAGIRGTLGQLLPRLSRSLASTWLSSTGRKSMGPSSDTESAMVSSTLSALVIDAGAWLKT